jgi:hypothetical protein
MGAALRTLLGSPLLVAATLLVAGLFWLASVALGLRTNPSGLVNVLAIPPFSTQFFDLQIGGEIFGNTGTALFVAFAFTIVRSIVWAILVGVLLEGLEYGRPSLVGALQGVKAIPTVIAVNTLLVAVLIAAFGILLPLLGPLGLFAIIAALLGGFHLLVFAPAAAIRGFPGLRPAGWKSVRAARLPGSRHVGMVGLYAFLAIGFMSLMQYLPGGSIVTANPSLGTWTLVLVATLIHVVFLAAFCHRWLAVEDQIPEPPPPRRRMLGRTHAPAKLRNWHATV